MQGGVLRAAHLPTSLLLALALGAGACTDDSDLDLAADRAAVTVCADGPTVAGIDVSKWQGAIDWPAVADAGIQFAFIRTTHGVGTIDEYFDDNWRQAREVGIVRGPYQYLAADQDPIAQADLMLSMIGQLEPGDLPPVLDVEDPNGIPAPATYVANVRAWMDHVEAALGVRPIIYTGKYYWQDHLASSNAFVDYPLWLAQYRDGCPDTPTPYTRWAFWQHTSTGHVTGISGNVDRDWFNGTLDDLRALGAVATCGDGVCSAGESTDSCADDCPPCQVIAEMGDVVDDASACFTGGGDPAFLRHEDAGYDGGLTWTHATDLATTENFGRWDLYLAAAGHYQVEVYTAAPEAQSVLARYTVDHAGQRDQVVLDQTAVDGWAVLGEFDFAAGGGQRIQLDDNTGEPGDANVQLVFDAVRLARLSTTSENPDVGGIDEPNGDVVAGCQVGGGGASTGLGVALALLALVRRRRR
jgi:MYXO-CTERM domain-containing protein